MSETPELIQQLWSAASAAGLACRPVAAPTGWNIGPVAAFIFPSEPVTIVDALMDTEVSRNVIADALAESGLSPSDVKRILVTHGHGDHFGSAAWIQEQSGCEVHLHPADIERMRVWDDRPNALRSIWIPLGVPAALVESWIAEPDDEPPSRADFTPTPDGATFQVGDTELSWTHRPGHSTGHVLISAEDHATVFVGDYLAANKGASAGLELDHNHPSGRSQLLAAHEAGLAAIADSDYRLMLPAHGPPATDVAAIAKRRLASGERRTARVRAAVEQGPGSAVDVGTRMYGDRVKVDPWGILSDTVGRLDQLVTDGVLERERVDGVDIFSVVS